jgi:hypothetical protein
MTEAIGAAQPRLGATRKVFAVLIRLHEAVHRCAYPLAEPDRETFQQRLNHLAWTTAELTAALHSCQRELESVPASRVEELLARLAMGAPAGHADSLRSHLIELEQDIRTLAGIIAKHPN